MKWPNVWIGLGNYGDRTLQAMAERLDLLEVFGYFDDGAGAIGRPLLCHIPLDPAAPPTPPHPRIIRLEVPLPGGEVELVEAAHQHLNATLRRGNNRESGYVFVLAHVEELAAHADVEDLSWLWSFATDHLDLTPVLVALVAVEPTAAGFSHRTAQLPAFRTLLAQLMESMSAAAVHRDGTSRVVLLDPSGLAAAEGTTPSRDALVLLFELLCSLGEQPLDTNLHALLHGPAAFEHGGFGSFGIVAEGVNFGPTVERLTRDLTKQLLLGIDRPTDQQLEVLQPFPSFEVLPPAVPRSAEALSTSFVPTFFQSEEDAADLLRAEEARLAVRIPEWWATEMQGEFLDVAPSRRSAAEALDEAHRWLGRMIQAAWREPAHTAVQVADALSACVTRVEAAPQAVRPGSKVGLVRQPDPGPAIEQLRKAVRERPSPVIALTLVAVVAAAAGILWYAAGLSLFGNFNRLTTGETRVLSLLVGIAGALASAAIPLFRWVVQPWRRITAASERLHAELARAHGMANQFRTSISAYVAESLTAEITAAFAQSLRVAEARFRATATAASAGTAEDFASFGIRTNPNLFERLEHQPPQDVTPDPDALSRQFRRRYCALSLGPPTEASCEVPSNHWAALAWQFTLQEVLERMASRAVLPQSLPQLRDPELLVFGYVGTTSDYRPGPETSNSLRRGDKLFRLTVEPQVELTRVLKR